MKPKTDKQMPISGCSVPPPCSLQDAQLIVRKAARCLGRSGLVHAYGHCSIRIDHEQFLVSTAKPLGNIGVEDQGTLVSLHKELPEAVLGEVRIHREIYRRRPEINGIVRSMPPRTMSLSVTGATPRPLHGMGAYFFPSPPLWDDPQLIRSDEKAELLAELMAESPAIVMRGNGVVTAAESLQKAVVLTWYLEDAARVELDCLQSGLCPPGLSSEQAAIRATDKGRIFERMWEYLDHGDIE